MNKNIKKHAIHETRKFKKDINKKVLMQFMQKNASFYSNRDYNVIQLASKKELNYAIKETLKQGGVYNLYLLSLIHFLIPLIIHLIF